MSSISDRPDVALPGRAPVSVQGPVGIGGWLLIVGAGQLAGTFVMPIVLAYQYFDPEVRQAFREIPLAMYGELALNAAWVLLALIGTVLFFRKSRHFPRVFILECVASVLIPILSIAWTALALSIHLGKPIGMFLELEPREQSQLVLAVIGAAIWIAYALKSRRVRNTFILGLSAHQVQADPRASETLLLKVIVAVILGLGVFAITVGVSQTIISGALSGQLVGGALQVALAFWLSRGSDVARIILAFLLALGCVLCIWIALVLPGQQAIVAAVMLVLALIFAVVFWVLVFSRRFRAELAIHAAAYRKPEV